VVNNPGEVIGLIAQFNPVVFFVTSAYIAITGTDPWTGAQVDRSQALLMLGLAAVPFLGPIAERALGAVARGLVTAGKAVVNVVKDVGKAIATGVRAAGRWISAAAGRVAGWLAGRLGAAARTASEWLGRAARRVANAVQSRLGGSAASTWGRPETLADHFNRHGPDFDAKSAEDYARRANQFFERRAQFPTKVDSDGVIRVYDPRTNTFGSYNPDGTTRTFFKPTKPTYFDEQAGDVTE
jgi:hypothetical protein